MAILAAMKALLPLLLLASPARAHHVASDASETVSVAKGETIYAASPVAGVNARFVVRRLSSDGGVLWETSYGRGQGEEPVAIAATQDGGVVVSGARKGGCFLVRWDAQGRLFYEVSPTGSGQCRPAGVVVDGEGSAYVLGTVEGRNGFDAMVWKFGPRGDQLWTYRYSTVATVYARDLYLDPRGDRVRAFVLRKDGTNFVEEFFRLDVEGRKL